MDTVDQPASVNAQGAMGHHGRSVNRAASGNISGSDPIREGIRCKFDAGPHDMLINLSLISENALRHRIRKQHEIRPRSPTREGLVNGREIEKGRHGGRPR